MKKKTKEKESGSYIWFMALLLAMLISSSSVLLVSFDKKFLIKNTGNVEEKEYLVGNIADYLNDEEWKLADGYFNQREIDHMYDVKIVFMFIQAIFVFSWISFFVFIIYFARIYFEKSGVNDWIARIGRLDLELIKDVIASNKTTIFKVMKTGAVCSMIFSLLLVLMGLNFNWFFDFFHKILFTEGSWIFYENDMIIKIFTFDFFKIAFIRIILVSLSISSIILGLSIAGKRLFFRNV